MTLSGEVLSAMGFKWTQEDRQPSKHWLLWIAPACIDPIEHGRRMFASRDDLGIELAHSGGRDDFWYCWMRADYAGRYSRFLHVRHVTEREEVVAIIEALTGRPFVESDCIYGAFHPPEDAERLRADADSLHMRLAKSWGERVEKERSIDAAQDTLVK